MLGAFRVQEPIILGTCSPGSFRSYSFGRGSPWNKPITAPVKMECALSEREKGICGGWRGFEALGKNSTAIYTTDIAE